MDFTEPTDEDCRHKKVVASDFTHKVIAMYYPQMGGYTSKCLISFAHGGVDMCFDALIWHNGQFPFEACDGNPARIHHCSPDQFIAFGESIKKAMLGK